MSDAAPTARDALVGWTTYADRPTRHRHGVLLDAKGRGYTVPAAGHTHAVLKGRALPSTPDGHDHMIARATSAVGAIDRIEGAMRGAGIAEGDVRRAEALGATAATLRKGALAASMVASGLAFVASLSAWLATRKQEETR